MHIPLAPQSYSLAQRLFPRLVVPSYREVSTESLDEKPSRVSDEDDERQSIEPLRQATWTAKRAALCATATVVIFALASLTALLISSEAHSNRQNMAPANLCGNSSAEALSLGCTFDQLLWAWLPPNCPHYANDEFLKAEEWKYYIDPLGKEQAVGENWAKAMDNKMPLWGERREHLTHCVYMFLSVGQIIRDGTSYPPRLVAYEHLEHCANIILKSLKRGKTWNNMETSTGRVHYDQSC
ncbi:hypothetical protein CcaCcLH18_10651 [Colletotrichum camelliae]|nr:hypothetical protein CcaCcLH18_10651 [Colletotrichum camelliae]